MISATVAAWALSGVDRCSMSCPGRLGFSYALNVANRTTGGGPWGPCVDAVLGDAAPMVMTPVAHTSAARVRRIGRARITSTSRGEPLPPRDWTLPPRPGALADRVGRTTAPDGTYRIDAPWGVLERRLVDPSTSCEQIDRATRTQVVARGADLAGDESGLGSKIREAARGEPVDHPLPLAVHRAP
jgi:hypothetical protein